MGIFYCLHMSILSKKVELLGESETLAMARLSRELKEKGLDVINMSLGEPDFDTPEFIKEAAIEAIRQNYSHYTPVAGYKDLLEAVCHKLKRDNQLTYSPANIVVSTGAKQSIANAVFALVSEGDEVILPVPYWVSYKEMVNYAGGTPVMLEAGIEKNFKPSAEDLEKCINAKTKLIIFSSPCNPTGSVWTDAELQSWAEVIERNPHVYIISDEIYELINFGIHSRSLASFGTIKDRVITVNGLSKGFAMTGWRLGYLAAHETIASACTKIQGQYTSATCSITQRAAVAALLANPENATGYMRDAFKKRRDLALHLMKDIPGMITNLPDGAFYIFPEVSAYFGKTGHGKSIENSKDLCMYLIHEAHVAITPGGAFGMDNHIRISYAAAEQDIEKAITRIKYALAKLV